MSSIIKTMMKNGFVCLLSSLAFVACSIADFDANNVEIAKPQHFIFGNWSSTFQTVNQPKLYLHFKDNNIVEILLKKDEKIIEESFYTYRIIDSESVQIDYAEPLIIKKSTDDYHIETGCERAMVDPPILCFRQEFEKIK